MDKEADALLASMAGPPKAKKSNPKGKGGDGAGGDKAPGKESASAALKIEGADELLQSLGVDMGTGGEEKKKAAKKRTIKKKVVDKEADAPEQKKETKLSAQALLVQKHLEQVNLEKESREKREAEEKERRAEEERVRKAEHDRLQAIKDEKKRRKREMLEKQKSEGTYLTPSQKRKQQRDKEAIERLHQHQHQLMMQQEEGANSIKSTSRKSSVDPSRFISSQQDEPSAPHEAEEATLIAPQAPDAKEAEAEEAEAEEEEPLESWEEFALEEEEEEAAPVVEVKKQKVKKEFRSPIYCVMGHVDTGKTSLLDKIRHSNVQEGEAGGITQQIGATFFPLANLREIIDKVKSQLHFEYALPGLLMIDTPGHESFTNLRSRGSNLCDIAIVVVDIMHGLEKQTLESLSLLKQRNCAFVVALNKIDRLSGWKPNRGSDFRTTLAKQSDHTKEHFEKLLKSTITAFMEQGYNAQLYYKNTSIEDTISLVPTSATTGEGLPDLLGYSFWYCQEFLMDQLLLRPDVDATVLEVKTLEGYGVTLDVILIHGELRQGDQIVLCGLNGAIVTTVRTILTPDVMRELRVKSVNYIHHAAIRAAIGVKLVAPGIDEVVAGTPIFVCNNPEDLEDYKREVTKDLNMLRAGFKREDEGVWVQASSLGSLEALLEFLSKCEPRIPVSGFNIGPIHKKDIIEASIMLNRKKEYSVILAFDLNIDKETEALAKKENVMIFSSDIIYHLFDEFTLYIEKINQKTQATNEDIIYPVELTITPYVFRNKDPIVIGVDVTKGILKEGTPVAAVKLVDGKAVVVSMGRIAKIEMNNATVDNVRPGGTSVAISIQPSTEDEKKIQFGRQVDATFKIYSKITRSSIDCMKSQFRSKLQDDDWVLMKSLKTYYGIA